jgi:glycosyltransferase involved in cell wall biosynthesis
MPRPRVSIVTIFLNAQRFLAEAIDSVLAQSYGDWELVLVDDGSTDGSSAIAREYAARDPARVRYLDHPNHINRGAAASRNLGIAASRGECVAFLDADDVWLPHKLERQVTILDSQPDAAMVCGAAEYWHGWSGRPEDMARNHVPALGVDGDRIHRPPALAVALHPLGTGTAPCPSDLVVRRRVLDQLGAFDEGFVGSRQLYEDQTLLAKIYLHAPVYVSTETWIKYRIHPESCSAEVDRRGDYHAVRRAFLHWLEQYLRRQQVDHPEVRAALCAALSEAEDVTGAPRTRWSLRLAGSNAARLVSPGGEANAIRIEVQHAASGSRFDVQANQPGFQVRAGEEYKLRFRAKADGPRLIGAGVAEAHQPWSGLGLYMEVRLTREWQSFEGAFVAARDESNARIHFDVGDSSVSVDFDSVELVRLSDGESLAAVRGRGELWRHEALQGVTPLSRNWGFDRGQPIDRHCIDRFLARHAAQIAGCVLEIGDNDYTRHFGAERVTVSEVLHVTPGHPGATLTGDLTQGAQLPSERFDTIIFTQTLQFIYDARAALATLHRMLKPGGVLLATFPGLSKVTGTEWGGAWFWGFTTASARGLFEEAFAPGRVDVEAFGNVLTASAFLYGVSAEELQPHELEYHDPEYELLIAVRAVKAVRT